MALDSPSTLPSPPTSPTSPITATTRIRIKASRRPNSISLIPLVGSESHVEWTRSMSPSFPDTPTSETTRMIPPASAVGKRSRRQSSITYYTPSSPAPWSQRSQPTRTQSSSVDSPRDVDPTLVNGRENVSKRSSLVLSLHSPSARESVSSLDAVGTREREPLTLVEKHADLLHFIAQKERKCLELRDQLAAHEKELSELKRRWERIVNHGHDPLPNSPTSGIGGSALDGLKEGVRMIAAGFSDLGGVIQDDSDGNNSFGNKPLNDSSIIQAKRPGSEYLSISSVSSIQEGTYFSGHVDGERETTALTVATAPSLSRASSLSSRIHKRVSRTAVREPTIPTSMPVSPLGQSPPATNLDVGMSLVLAPSPTLVPPLLGMPPDTTPVFKHKPSLSGSAHASTSWMDNMGKKLSDLHRGQTFSKSQKRATSLLAGVSSTISAAFSPGPTATTPAPVPTAAAVVSPLSPTQASPQSLAVRPVLSPPAPCREPEKPQPQSHSRAYPSYASMADWLDEEEEQTVRVGGVDGPDAKSRPPPHGTGHGEEGERSGAAGANVPVPAFDDDWNW